MPINPLLGMLGQQGRDFQGLLLEQQSHEIEISSFDADSGDGELTLLSHIQNDVLLNRASTGGFIPSDNDRSITVHSCHTRMREVEVLKEPRLSGA